MVISELKDYLLKTFTRLEEVKPLAEQDMAGLPLFLQKSNNFYQTAVLEVDMVLAEQVHQESTPVQLGKEYNLLKKQFNKPVAYVFKSLSTYQRNRLLDLRIPFIVPFKQLYLPFVALSLTEVNEVVKRERSTLRPASQCLLLFHLEVERISHLNFQHIGSRLQYTPMTITRAAQELSDFGLARIEGRKDKFLLFKDRRSYLWEKALKYLVSPVKINGYIDIAPTEYMLFKTHDNALAEYSDLSPGRREAYALAPDDFQSLKAKTQLNIDYFEGNVRIEHWTYPPGKLTTTNIVDPLSLYLSMRDDEDDRVSMALDQLLKKVLW
ncbi:hypothetical protein SAMN05518672_101854 [Chitinophaga sp. CF118]|uniref:hypothetical protein n=1 Tax=Chitinophaga sp. CF118 TaxID=1884367 RepID=UPI0008E0A59F|nr:hypothetical protein [Chitinophaga sp. CF118]SFD16984.1 hypothetical protein SAMN05518672_101854 [Chitinophaga sp. CF118]